MTDLTCRQCDFDGETVDEIKNHLEMKHHMVDGQEENKYSCDFCEYETNDLKSRDDHAFENHGKIDCDKCEYSALDAGIMKKHMQKHTGRIIYTCGICEFEATNQSFLEAHTESKHSKKSDILPPNKCDRCEKVFVEMLQFKHHICKPQSKYQCEQCTFAAVSLSELLDHVETKHTNNPAQTISDPSRIKCDQCDFTAENVSTFILHIRTEHRHELCQYCDHVAQNRDALKAHMFDNHEEVVMLHTMAQQMNNVSESFALFETFKNELGNVIKSVLENQNSIKQELFLIRNKQVEMSAKQITERPTPPSTESATASTRPAPRRSTAVLTPPPSDAHSATQPQKKKKTLFIGDSISANINIEAV